MQKPFIEPTPTRESCWRAIVMMGRAVASYKFALAASLLDLSSKGNEFVSLEHLAEPFSRHLSEHIKDSEKQITASRSTFLDSCRQANSGEISNEALMPSMLLTKAIPRLGSSMTIGRPEVESR